MREDRDIIPTRQSLLSRIKDWNDQESWRDFFNTYWKLIFSAARKSGLTNTEAEEVVQETVISVCKSIRGFDYDPRSGSFKGWLMRLTAWRINDQLRKRRGLPPLPASGSEETGTDASERVEDPARTLEGIWEEEWRLNLLEAAVERVKQRVDHKQFQIYDLYVHKHISVKRIRHLLGVSATQVYLAKHRVLSLVRKEVKLLEKRAL